ncbi:MAG: HEPN domain-containing protein [Bilifractor sp.]
MEKIEDQYYDYCDLLTPYGIAARYPNELYLEDRHAQVAIKTAEEILQWVTIKLESYIP